jgi:hypothetical protein
MDAPALTLRPAAPADIDAVMAIERSPEFELCVGRSEEGEHRAMLDSPSHAYRLGIGAGGAIEAFAILRGSATRARISTSSGSPSAAPDKGSASLS